MNKTLTNNETHFITLGGDFKTLHSISMVDNQLVLNVYDFSTVSGTSTLKTGLVVQTLNPHDDEFSVMFKAAMRFIHTDLKYYHVNPFGVQNGYMIEKYLVAFNNDNEIIINTMNDEECWVEPSFIEYLSRLQERVDNIGTMAKYFYNKYCVQRILRHPYTQEYIDFGVRYNEGVTKLNLSDPELLKY